MNWIKIAAASRFDPGLLRSLLMYFANPGQLQRMKRFYSQFIPSGGLAFDIGAHTGNRSHVFCSLGASCVAVEPQPAVFAVLQAVMASYTRSPSRCVLLPLAIADKLGSLPLYVCQRYPTLSTFDAEWVQAAAQTKNFGKIRWQRGPDVSITTIDSLISQYGQPDFIKIDVEGFEPQVIAGLSQPVAALSFEYLPAHIERAIASIEALQRLGTYKFQYTRIEAMHFSSNQWLESQQIISYLRGLPHTAASGDIYARLA